MKIRIEKEIAGVCVMVLEYESNCPVRRMKHVALLSRHDERAPSFARGRKPTRGYTIEGADLDVSEETECAVDASFRLTFDQEVD